MATDIRNNTAIATTLFLTLIFNSQIYAEVKQYGEIVIKKADPYFSQVYSEIPAGGAISEKSIENISIQIFRENLDNYDGKLRNGDIVTYKYKAGNQYRVIIRYVEIAPGSNWDAANSSPGIPAILKKNLKKYLMIPKNDVLNNPFDLKFDPRENYLFGSITDTSVIRTFLNNGKKYVNLDLQRDTTDVKNYSLMDYQDTLFRVDSGLESTEITFSSRDSLPGRNIYHSKYMNTLEKKIVNYHNVLNSSNGQIDVFFKDGIDMNYLYLINNEKNISPIQSRYRLLDSLNTYHNPNLWWDGPSNQCPSYLYGSSYPIISGSILVANIDLPEEKKFKVFYSPADSFPQNVYSSKKNISPINSRYFFLDSLCINNHPSLWWDYPADKCPSYLYGSSYPIISDSILVANIDLPEEKKFRVFYNPADSFPRNVFSSGKKLVSRPVISLMSGDSSTQAFIPESIREKLYSNSPDSSLALKEIWKIDQIPCPPKAYLNVKNLGTEDDFKLYACSKMKEVKSTEYISLDDRSQRTVDVFWDTGKPPEFFSSEDENVRKALKTDNVIEMIKDPEKIKSIMNSMQLTKTGLIVITLGMLVIFSI